MDRLNWISVSKRVKKATCLPCLMMSCYNWALIDLSSLISRVFYSDGNLGTCLPDGQNVGQCQRSKDLFLFMSDRFCTENFRKFHWIWVINWSKYRYHHYSLMRLMNHNYDSFMTHKWRFIWSARWSDLENDRPHWRHLNGLAPVCFLMWRVSSSLRAKRQLQPGQLHLYGFSPVWVRWWAFRWEDFVYAFVHPK